MDTTYTSQQIGSTGALDSEDDVDACREMLNGGSKSFHMASLLLPKSFSSKAAALYGFCRMADDAIDEGDCKTSALAMLHRRLDAIYAGEPESYSSDRALEQVVRQVDLPKELLLALLEGFEWDSLEKRYETFEGVIEYSMRVAGTVGVMMAVLMGVREQRMLARAADLGAAMQLTNISRDVGEDARAGRLYLPENWLKAAGIDPDSFLENPEFTPALGDVVSRLLGQAERLYRRADSGLAALPWGCRPGMYAARLLYAEIGGVIAAAHYDSVNQRAYVDSSAKLRLLSKVPRIFTMGREQIEAGLLEESLPEAEFLLASVQPSESSIASDLVTDTGGDSRNSIVRILDLFEDLHQYELQQHRAQNN